MKNGITLEIIRELGANAYRLSLKKSGLSYGFMTGYIDHRSGVVTCYPAKGFVPGAFSQKELPLRVRREELNWQK